MHAQVTPVETSETSVEAPARHFILGTAGHIDHGKTSLVRALTGTDTDRLPEEKKRGMTIELGFASLNIDNLHFGIVDVPGHERFVKTMVAGATGIDIAIIVVAADDSIMPQTIEHIEILNLLGVKRAVIALTKIDLVDPELVELAAQEITQTLQETSFANAPVCRFSSITGEGLNAVRNMIASAVVDVQDESDSYPFRLAVDRVFTVQGRGTVVTGSALRGTVQTGDTLELLPGGTTGRVRDLQTHGTSRTKLSRGQRIALNLSGVDRDEIVRGYELATPGYLQPTRVLDVRLQTLRSNDKSLKSTNTVRLGIGTIEVPVRVVLLQSDRLDPGQFAYAQLRSGTAIVAAHGQRFIIRNENATRTIGGGVVLSPVPARRRTKWSNDIDWLRALDSADPLIRLEQVCRRAGFKQITELRLCAQTGLAFDQIATALSKLKTAKRLVTISGTSVTTAPAAIDDLQTRLTGWLERYHKRHPDTPGRKADSILGYLERVTDKPLARPLYELMLQRGALKTLGQYVCLPQFAPALPKADEQLLTELVCEMEQGRFQPPTLDALAAQKKVEQKRLQRLATLAVALGELVQIEANMYLHINLEQKLRELVIGMIKRQSGVTVSEIRETIGSSRKYVVPFMEYLDRVGMTKRVGDRRVLSDNTNTPVG